jgi:hypothetical protein
MAPKAAEKAPAKAPAKKTTGEKKKKKVGDSNSRCATTGTYVCTVLHLAWCMRLT